MTTTAGRWAAATASVRGASHDRDGKPNQDAVRVVQVTGPTPGLVAAVCDGHGGDRYVRSDVGSRLGVEVACDVGRRALEDLGPLATASAIEARLAGPAAQSIVERWRERVLDDVKGRAFTDDERARAGVSLDGDPLISYGATLLLAILGPSWVGLLQIGDGDVTVVRGARAESPVPDDDRLVGGETTSLCLPTAVADARISVLVEPLPEMLILTTDGYANSFASPTWRTDAGIDLRNHVHRIGLDGVEKKLASWLADSATAGGDDVSMALIQRVDAVGSAGAGAAATRSTSNTARPSPVKAATTSQRRALIPAALIVTALAAAAGGWMLGRSDDSSADPGTTVAALTTSIAPTTSITLGTTPESTPTIPETTDSSAPTTSAAPTTTTTAPELVAGATEHLLRGVNDVLFLTFDANQPSPQRVHFLRWMKIAEEPVALPEPHWEFVDGSLRWNKVCVQQALVVLREGNYIWAVASDGQTLTSYDLGTGVQSPSVLIADGRDSGATAPAADPQCPPVTQGGIVGPEATTTTTKPKG